MAAYSWPRPLRDFCHPVSQSRSPQLFIATVQRIVSKKGIVVAVRRHMFEGLPATSQCEIEYKSTPARIKVNAETQMTVLAPTETPYVLVERNLLMHGAPFRK